MDDLHLEEFSLAVKETELLPSVSMSITVSSLEERMVIVLLLHIIIAVSFPAPSNIKSSNDNASTNSRDWTPLCREVSWYPKEQ